MGMTSHVAHELGHSLAGKILFNDSGTIHLTLNPFKNPYVLFAAPFYPMELKRPVYTQQDR